MAMVEKHRPSLLRNTYTAVNFAIVSTLAGCSGPGNPIKTLPTPKPAPTSIPNPEGLVSLPFSADPNIKIRQGWLYDDGDFGGGLHAAQDYIKGPLEGNWQPFLVLAPGDGEICFNPPNREGNAVWEVLEIKGERYYWFGGHLESVTDGMPLCSTGRTNAVKRGEVVGMAGASGVKNPNTGLLEPTWIHLHSEFKNAQNQPIDAYDLRAQKERYPDPAFSNGKLCGAEALLLKCKEQAVRLGQAMGLIVAEPEVRPTQRTQTDEIKAATVVPTAKPASTAIPPTNRPATPPTTRPTEKPVPTEVKTALTPEQDAIQGAIANWLSDLDRTWGKPGVISNIGSSNRTYVQTKIIKKGFTYQDIARGMKEDDPRNNLTVRWVVERGYIDGPYYGSKQQYWAFGAGETEIAGVQLKVVRYNLASNTDRLNGFGPNADVELSFSQRNRIVSQRTKAPSEALIATITADFTGWDRETYDFNIRKVANHWDLTHYYSNNHILPLRVLTYYDM